MNDVQLLSVIDLTFEFIFNGGPLNFFRDGTTTCSREVGTGFVGYIRIYDQALARADAGGPGGVCGVPENSTWAMMLLGFGFVGAALRRRYQLQALRLTCA
jgi:hypothetical protein